MATRIIKVKPSRPGLIVNDQYGRRIPDEGIETKRTPYIVGRMREGDLVLIETPAPSPKKKGGDK